MVESAAPLLRSTTTARTESLVKEEGNHTKNDYLADPTFVDNRNDDECDYILSRRSGFSSHPSLHQGTAIGRTGDDDEDEDDEDEEILSDMELPKNLKLVRIDEVISDVRDSPFEADDPVLKRAMETIMRSFPNRIESASTTSIVEQVLTEPGDQGEIETVLSNEGERSSVDEPTISSTEIKTTERDPNLDVHRNDSAHWKEKSAPKQPGSSIYRRALRYHEGKTKRNESRDDASVDPVIEVKASTSTVEAAGGSLYRRAVLQKTGKQNQPKKQSTFPNYIDIEDSEDKEDLISDLYGHAFEFINSFTSDQSAADDTPRTQGAGSKYPTAFSDSAKVASPEKDLRAYGVGSSDERKDKTSPEMTYLFAADVQPTVRAEASEALQSLAASGNSQPMEEKARGSGRRTTCETEEKRSLNGSNLFLKDGKSSAQKTGSGSIGVPSERRKVILIENSSRHSKSSTSPNKKEKKDSEMLDWPANHANSSAQPDDFESTGVERKVVSPVEGKRNLGSWNDLSKAENTRLENSSQSAGNSQRIEPVVDLTDVNGVSPEQKKLLEDEERDYNSDAIYKKEQKGLDPTDWAAAEVTHIVTPVDLTSCGIFSDNEKIPSPNQDKHRTGSAILQGNQKASVGWSTDDASDCKPTTLTIDLTSLDDVAYSDSDIEVPSEHDAQEFKSVSPKNEEKNASKRFHRTVLSFKSNDELVDLTTMDDVFIAGTAKPAVDDKHHGSSDDELEETESYSCAYSLKVREDKQKTPFESYGGFLSVAAHRKSPELIYVEDLATESHEYEAHFTADETMKEGPTHVDRPESRPTNDIDIHVSRLDGTVKHGDEPVTNTNGTDKIDTKVDIIRVFDENEDVTEGAVQAMSKTCPRTLPHVEASRSALPASMVSSGQQDQSRLQKGADNIQANKEGWNERQRCRVTFQPVPTDDCHSDEEGCRAKSPIELLEQVDSRNESVSSLGVVTRSRQPTKLAAESNEISKDSISLVNATAEVSKPFLTQTTRPKMSRQTDVPVKKLAESSKSFRAASPPKSSPPLSEGKHSIGASSGSLKTQSQVDAKSESGSSFTSVIPHSSSTKIATQTSSRNNSGRQDENAIQQKSEKSGAIQTRSTSPSKTAAEGWDSLRAKRQDQIRIKLASKANGDEEVQVSSSSSQTREKKITSPMEDMKKSALGTGKEKVRAVPENKPSSQISHLIDSSIQVVDPVKRSSRSLSPRKTNSRRTAFDNKISRSSSPAKRMSERHRIKYLQVAEKQPALDMAALRQKQLESRPDQASPVEERPEHSTFESSAAERITTEEAHEVYRSRDAAFLKAAMKKELLETMLANEKAEQSESLRESLGASARESAEMHAKAGGDRDQQNPKSQARVRDRKSGKRDIRLDLEDFTKVVMSGSQMNGADSMDKSIMRLVCNDDEKGGRIAPVVSNYSQDLAISDCETSSSDSFDENEMDMPSSEVKNDYGDSQRNVMSEAMRRKTEDGSEDSIDDDDNAGSNAQDSDSKISVASILETEESDMDMDMDNDMYESFTVPFVVKILDKGCAWLEGNDDFTCGYTKPSLLHETKKGPPKMSANQNNRRFRSKLTKQPKIKRKGDSRIRSKAPACTDTGATILSPSESSFKMPGSLFSNKLNPQEEKQTTPKSSNTRATKEKKRTVMENKCSITPNSKADGLLKDNPVLGEKIDDGLIKHAIPSTQKKDTDFGETNPSVTETNTDEPPKDRQEIAEQTKHGDKSRRTQSRSVPDVAISENSQSSTRGVDPPAEVNPPRSPFQAKLQQRLARIRGDCSDTGSSVEGDGVSNRFESFSRKISSKERNRAGDMSTVSSVSNRSAGGPESRFASPFCRHRAAEKKNKETTGEDHMEQIQESAKGGKAMKDELKDADDASTGMPPQSSQSRTRSPKKKETKEQHLEVPREDLNSAEKMTSKSTENVQQASGSEKRLASPSRQSRPASPKKKKVGEHHTEITREDASAGELSSKKSKDHHSEKTQGHDSNLETDSFSTLTEEERLAALELAERLRRRAAALKRRRKIRERRLKELEQMEGEGSLGSSRPPVPV